MSGNPQIILVGAGGHCRSCVDVIEEEDRFRIAGVVERPGRDLAKGSPVVFDYPLLGTDAELPELRKQYLHALVAVGQVKTAELRMSLFRRLKDLGFVLPTLVSPHAYVSRRAQLGEGTIVMHGAMVNANAQVGVNCILNSHCVIEHDAVIGDHCHVSTHAVVNGGATVGDGSFAGSHAVVVQDASVPPSSFLKANSLYI